MSHDSTTIKFQEAWNEWIRGNEIGAAKIWIEIKDNAVLSKDKFTEIDALNLLAMYQRVWEGKEEEKQINLDTILDYAQSQNYQKGIADVLVELALRTNSHNTAQNNFKKAKEIFEDINDKKGLIKLNYRYAKFLVERGIERFGFIFEQFQIALQFAIEENDKYYEAQIHHGIGQAFLRLGNLKEASHHFEIAFQIFQYLCNDRKTIELLVSIAEVEMQTQVGDSLSILNKYYQDFIIRIQQILDKIPLSDKFYHLSRFSDMFLELEEFKQVNLMISELETILRGANINSSLYFQGKMALALIKGNVELAKLNLTNAEELYFYILRRRDQARTSDLYGALLSLAIISIYRYRIIFDTNHLSTAQELIQDAIKISKETDHIRGYVRANMVDAMLKITLGSTGEDLSEMEKVLQIAQEKGLGIEARHAQQELTRFKRIVRIQENTMYTDRPVAEVLQYALEAKKVVRNS